MRGLRLGGNSTSHPYGDLLLPYADGELPPRKARQVRSHLESCWQCRADLEEIQHLICDCVRYRKDLLKIHLPSPSAPWGDIYQGFARVEESRNNVPPFLRILNDMRRTARIWSPAAIALALICVLVIYFGRTPAVQAAELLGRAVAAAQSRPAHKPGLLIRTSRHPQVALTIYPAAQETAVRGEDQAAIESVQRLFETAHFDGTDPFSAKAFLAWHDGLPSRQDEVIAPDDRQPAAERWYLVRTTPASGDVATASLKLHATDLAPMEERIEFRNREWLEITETPAGGPSAPPSVARANAAATTAPLSQRNSVAEAAPEPPSRPEVSAAEELQVFAGLHRAGADLGDPVEVTRDHGQIVVSGVGLPAERQKNIQRALNSIPNVVTRFTEPAAAIAPQRSQASPAPSDPQGALPFQLRLEQQLGGRERYEQLSATLLDGSDAIMARAYAMRRLAERFPASVEAGMSVDDRRLLRKLEEEHAAEISKHAAQLERTLTAVLSPLGASSTGMHDSLNSARWQPATDEIFRSARSLETLLAAMLGATQGNAPDAKLPSEVLSSASRLTANAAAFRKLIAGEIQ